MFNVIIKKKTLNKTQMSVMLVLNDTLLFYNLYRIYKCYK